MPRVEPMPEIREEWRLLRKRLAQLEASTANTPKRRQNWAVKYEIEVLEANLASLERRYRFAAAP